MVLVTTVRQCGIFTLKAGKVYEQSRAGQSAQAYAV